MSAFFAYLQYLYFLRFSLLCLLTVPLLALADRFTGINSVTRGIFTSTEVYSFIGEAFFLTCAGVIALITSRVVVLNGRDRYQADPPQLLSKFLGHDSDPYAGGVLLTYQLPGIGVLTYLIYTAHRETAVTAWFIAILMSLIGIALALLFWTSLNVIYYWTADDATGVPPRTILLPRCWLGLEKLEKAKPASVLIPPQFISNLWGRIAGLGPGYSKSGKVLYSGHQFTIIAAIGYFLVYLFMFPLTSPFTAGKGYTIGLVGFGILTLAVAISILWGLTPPCIRWAKYLIVIELLTLSGGAFGLFLQEIKARQSFPVLCSVLVLLTLVSLIMAGIAFYVDRLHLPVGLAFAALILLLHGGTSLIYRLPGIYWNPRLGGFSDHYFEVLNHGSQPELATPADVLANRTCTVQNSPVPCPVIVVSATGGGIHAAAWTTLMLTSLEDSFRNEQRLASNQYSFHNNVALFSTVSGGSVGLLPFLNEYTAAAPFTSPGWQQWMFNASNCSALEAVAWGLEYRDFDVFLAPVLSGLFSPQWDRSTALEAGIRRHLFDAPCPSNNPADGKDRAKAPIRDPKEEKTLGDLSEQLKAWTRHAGHTGNYVPAFTMNTTAAETGGRFLLSNYHIEPDAIADAGVAPAEDFLSGYGRRSASGNADIHLSTAARLSATFPFVSSAARSNRTEDAGTLHFVDGGYYDNDGIASVIEFLLAGRKAIARPANAQDKTLGVPLLLIEIRDGADLDANSSPEQGGKAPFSKDVPTYWNSFRQFSGPLGAFWSAGHEAVSRRNRRELEILMDMLQAQQIPFKHIVLDYRDATESNGKKQGSAQPLSWFLTPLQTQKIEEAKSRVAPCIAVASTWTADALMQKPSTNPVQQLSGNIQVDHCVKP
ncbi:hypothetical protein FTW19_07585 [Terriglobus albidus]|uniref:Uncharacterized protein n=1 Tax=Terriglobus albidus TaxID=1592106 RepID=A0A5B9ECS0_9BACT|nr:patatin-like phospholipase family protein [Terriglobus albidus]QEE27866.1 hypothetical protein FTW19_07585 [Terriglobus albidus]